MARIKADTAQVFFNDLLVGTLNDAEIIFNDANLSPSARQVHIQKILEETVDKLIIQIGVQLFDWSAKAPVATGSYWFVGTLKNPHVGAYRDISKPVKIHAIVNGEYTPHEYRTPDMLYWQEANGKWYGPLPDSAPPDGWQQQ